MGHYCFAPNGEQNAMKFCVGTTIPVNFADVRNDQNYKSIIGNIITLPVWINLNYHGNIPINA